LKSLQVCVLRLPRKIGVTDYEGLYFLGMPWLHSRKFGILFGVGDDAAYLAAHIALTGEKLFAAAA
jgi:hypothetical protein